MNCTAHTRVKNGTKVRSERCVRELGHCGLHRYFDGTYIQEFPDSQAWFPKMSQPARTEHHAKWCAQAVAYEVGSGADYTCTCSGLPG